MTLGTHKEVDDLVEDGECEEGYLIDALKKQEGIFFLVRYMEVPWSWGLND